MKLVGSILGVIALLGAFFGVHEWQESRYALRSALAQTAQEIKDNRRVVDYHIANQQREALEYRLEKKQAEYKVAPTKDKKEMIDDLLKRLKEKDNELKRLEERK